LIFAVVLLALGASPADAHVDGVITDVHSLPMRVEWRQEGPAGTCGSTCRSWVSAVGVTGNTPADFNTFVQGRGAEDAMIKLSINHGDCFHDDNRVATRPPVTLMTASWSSMGTR
jgi:hypothetical protein